MIIPIKLLSKSRKATMIFFSVLVIMCVAVAVIGFISWTSDQETLRKYGQPSFNTLPQAELKSGLIVKGTLDMSLGAYAKEYKTGSGNDVPEDADRIYYIVPVYDKVGNGKININYFITYMADPEDFPALDAVVEQTLNGTAKTVYKVNNARITDLPDDAKQYLTEWTESPHFFEGGSFIDWCAKFDVFKTADKQIIRSKIAPYMITRTATAGASFDVVWLCLGLAAAFLAVLLLLRFYKTPSLKDPPGGNDFSRLREMMEKQE